VIRPRVNVFRILRTSRKNVPLDAVYVQRKADLLKIVRTKQMIVENKRKALVKDYQTS